jgi:hypothetical protein
MYSVHRLSIAGDPLEPGSTRELSSTGEVYAGKRSARTLRRPTHTEAPTPLTSLEHTRLQLGWEQAETGFTRMTRWLKNGVGRSLRNARALGGATPTGLRRRCRSEFHRHHHAGGNEQHTVNMGAYDMDRSGVRRSVMGG